MRHIRDCDDETEAAALALYPDRIVVVARGFWVDRDQVDVPQILPAVRDVAVHASGKGGRFLFDLVGEHFSDAVTDLDLLDLDSCDALRAKHLQDAHLWPVLAPLRKGYDFRQDDVVLLGSLRDLADHAHRGAQPLVVGLEAHPSTARMQGAGDVLQASLDDPDDMSVAAFVRRASSKLDRIPMEGRPYGIGGDEDVGAPIVHVDEAIPLPGHRQAPFDHRGGRR